MYTHTNWPPSDFIYPLLTSTHFGVERIYYGRNMESNYFFDYAGADFLKRFGPVGCRDQATLDILQKYDIPASFTGCLTLTLEPYPDVEKTDEILLVDVCHDIRTDEICRIIRQASGRPVRVFTHALSRKAVSEMSFEDRLRHIEYVLRMFQSAYCVVTYRLHVALPCLALGTPSLLVEEERSVNRIGPYYPFFERCNIDEILNGEKNDFFINPKFSDDDGWKDIRDNLRSLCKGFVKQVSESTPDVPNPSEMVRRNNLRREALERIIADYWESSQKVNT
jgi:hypothetical protein